MKRSVMVAAAVCVAAIAAMPAAAQGRWVYPRGERQNPLAPPAQLYTGELAPKLVVTTVMAAEGRPMMAVVRYGEPMIERRSVRAGDRIGPYRIERVQENGLWVWLTALGSERRMFIWRAGIRRGQSSMPETR